MQRCTHCNHLQHAMSGLVDLRPVLVTVVVTRVLKSTVLEIVVLNCGNKRFLEKQLRARVDETDNFSQQFDHRDACGQPVVKQLCQCEALPRGLTHAIDFTPAPRPGGTSRPRRLKEGPWCLRLLLIISSDSTREYTRVYSSTRVLEYSST